MSIKNNFESFSGFKKGDTKNEEIEKLATENDNERLEKGNNDIERLESESSMVNEINQKFEEIQELKSQLDFEDIAENKTKREIARNILANTTFYLLFLCPGNHMIAYGFGKKKEIVEDLEKSIKKYLRV